VAWERSQAIVQAIVDNAPKANRYFSDAFNVYASLWYHWGRYAVSDGKTNTYSVEGNNAELRHYLARLARSSRCFSRCPYALHCAIRLFVYYFNQRQLKKQLFPKYTFHIIDFVYSPT
jgi:IS1 family transposase